jgi:hypothetical protein
MRIMDIAVQAGCRLAHGRRNPSPPFMVSRLAGGGVAAHRRAQAQLCILLNG